MRGVVIDLVEMSVTAGYVILILILARVLLKRLPRIIAYALWAVAGFRLISPVSFSGPFSLVPYNVRTTGGVLSLSQTALTAATSVWMAGFLLMVGYGAVSTVILHSRLRGIPAAHGTVHVVPTGSPFVFGLFRPQIYIPSGLSPDEEGLVVRHEQTHIHRHDHLIKAGAYLILTVHWFNPLVWAAFVLMEADMELSCDERVLSGLNGSVRKDYSRLLLSLASRRQPIPALTAFGEGGIKTRIVHALSFRKHSRTLIALSLCLAVLTSAGLVANRTEPSPPVPVPTMAELDAFFNNAVDSLWDENGGDWHIDTWTRTWHNEGLQAEAGGYLPQLRQTVSRDMPLLTGDWGAKWYQTLYMDAANALST